MQGSSPVSFPGRSAARSSCEAVRCRAGAVQSTVFGTVPVLRSGMKNAAPRPGHKKKFNIFSLDIIPSKCIFLGISSQPEGALPGTLWNVGVGAAPAGGEQTWLHALGRPWVSVRAHYGALPLAWLDGDRQRREIVVSQVPGRTDRG